jgi:multicomponent Na+:H+ antiporter subunit C
MPPICSSSQPAGWNTSPAADSRRADGADRPAANALPQAMILTAIVIGFAMITFLLVLLYRTYAETGTLDADDAR